MKLHALAFAAALAASALAAQTPARAADPAKPAWDVNHPPGPARTVKIDTQTGTWMNVDVSPDGRTLVFDLLGDLYTLPIGGGEAHALTHSIAWEQQARFSPDGKRIAFTSDAGGGDNLWVMDADGSHAREVSHEDFRMLNNPVWDPSGRFIAVKKHYTGTRSAGSGEIWLYAADGAANGKGIALNEKPDWQKDLGEPALSPDGRYLYHSHEVAPGHVFEYNKDGNKGLYAIFRQDLHDGSVERFVSGPGGAVRPVPSPDGRWLAFVRRVRMQSTLFLKDLHSGEERPVWGGLDRDMQEIWAMWGVYPNFAWTPDAKTIVVWGQGRLWRVDPFAAGGAGSAAEIPFHVKDTREVREALRVPQVVAPERFDVHQLRWAQVTPDGKTVIFAALGHLYAKPLAGGDARRLTTADDRFEYYPALSRDGSRLAFVTWNDAKLGEVRVLELASGAETVITREPGKYLAPQFSPDGRTLAYEKARGGFLTSPWWGLNLGVYVAAADSSTAPERITADGEAPQFGARDDELFVSREAEKSEVERAYSLVRIDLHERRETTLATSEYASDYRVSPDGRWLGFTERFHAYLLPLPAVGKPLNLSAQADSLPLRRLDRDAAENLRFAADAASVTYTLGDQLFRVKLAEAFAPGDAKPFTPAAEGVKIGFSAPSDKPSGRIALVGARIATLKGDQVIEDGTLVVDANRIVAVGASGSVAVPADARRIDVHGKTIVPGFVDAHWHGSMGEDGLIPQRSWIDGASLAFGVTTLHDPSNDSAQIFTHGEMQRAGLVVAPRIYSTGTILYGARTPFTAVVNGYDDALTHLRRLKADGAISVKSYQQPRRDQRQQIVAAARATGMMVVPEGGSLFEQNMSMVVDGHTGVEHAIPVERSYDDVRELWSQTEVGYTPTFNVAYGGLDGEHYWYARTEVWKHPLLTKHVPAALLDARAVRRETAPDEDFNVLRVAQDVNALSKAGVRINIGAHGQREGLGAHWEMWMMVLGGATPLEAIRNATLNPAHYLGLDHDLGSLEVGKLADLVIIDGNPLADIRQSDRVVQVMQNGRLYDAATLDEVAPRQVRRAPYFFSGQPGTPIAESLGQTHGDD